MIDVVGAFQAYNAFDALSGESRFTFARERYLGIKTLQQVRPSHPTHAHGIRLPLSTLSAS